MLQFIVLGVVPGTSIKVTFTMVLVAGFIFTLVMLLAVEFAKIKQLLKRAKPLELTQTTQAS